MIAAILELNDRLDAMEAAKARDEAGAKQLVEEMRLANGSTIKFSGNPDDPAWSGDHTAPVIYPDRED